MSNARQAFRAGALICIASSFFGGLFILSKEVHALQMSALTKNGPSMTFGDPANPLCTIRLDGIDHQLAVQVSEQVWRTIIACRAEQSGGATRPAPEALPSQPLEIEV